MKGKGGEGMAEPEADPPRDAFTRRRAERRALHQLCAGECKAVENQAPFV